MIIPRQYVSMVPRAGLGQDTTSDPFSNISTAFSTASSDLFAGLGPTELLILGLGAFALLSMILTTRSAVGGVTGFVKKRRRRRQRRKELEEEYAGL